LSVFPHDILKNKLDTEMFHDKSMETVYFGIKRSRSRVTRKNYCRGSMHSCECWLLL